MKVREATDTDFPTLAEVQGAVWPDHATTAETLAHEDADLRRHPIGAHLWRVVAEDSAGRVVGTGSLMQWPGMFHPGRYHAEVLVRPEARCRGAGRALAAALEAHLRERGAREVLATSREDCPEGLAFLSRRGFGEHMRYFASALTLATFDPARWAGAASARTSAKATARPRWGATGSSACCTAPTGWPGRPPGRGRSCRAICGATPRAIPTTTS